MKNSQVRLKVDQKNNISSSNILQSQSMIVDAKEGEHTKEPKGVSFFELFRFADGYDRILMFFGTFGALMLGGSTPLFILFWGQFTDVFTQNPSSIVDQALEVLKKFIYVGIGTLICGWLMITCWLITGERQSKACRKKYFESLLRQQIGWFDTINQSELSSNFISDTSAYQGAIGQKVSLMMSVVGTFLAGFTISFVKGWLMSLVCLAGIPLIGIAGYLHTRALQTRSKQFQKIYTKAGGISEQTISSIKTVKQLNGQQHEQRIYEDCLDQVKKDSTKYGVIIALSMSLLYAAMFLLYALGYWYGSNCAQGNSHCPPSVSGKVYSAGDVMTVFFSVLVGCVNLMQLAPALKKIAQGADAASRIFHIIDRQPLIQNPINGLRPQIFKGHIKFQHVVFAYPKDKERLIFKNISIEFHVNNTALVGESGCGKSTILQLILRFYDPLEGRILLDGNDLRQLDLIWLRQRIGYVGQQPVLFATSIKENLLLGNELATEDDIIYALKQAQAYDFVFNQLQNKLQTYVGSGGGQISGGQKQRIAIARALLKKPKILLLDQATSALDRKNEKLIQQTLNNISKGLTTITVAHRVQSIMNSDIIYVINRGEIEQKGKFNELKRYQNFQHKEQDKHQQGHILNAPVQKQNELIQKKIEKQSAIPQTLDNEELKKKQAAQLIKKHEKGIMLRVFSYLKDSKLLFVFGILLTIVLGLVFPVFSIFLSQLLDAIIAIQIAVAKNRSTVDERHSSNIASLVFVILAVALFILTFLRELLTYIVGNEITNNIRKTTFHKILRMPVSWFDKEQNNCGILSSRLGTDCQTINGMATTYIFILLQSLVTFCAGVIIALVYEWRTALVALALLPLVIFSAKVKSSQRQGLSKQMDKVYKESSLIIMQSLTNIRTVVSFGVQNTVMHKYIKYLDAPSEQIIKKSALSGFFFGMSQVITFLVFGILFYVGTIFIRDYGVNILSVFTAIYSIFFAGITLGNNSHFLPDILQAKLAASHIFTILDSQDEQQSQIKQESKLIKQGIKGHIKLQGVTFKYESRNQHVFKDINIQILPGQKVAFVGPSGCGKSTILQLLLRFYYPETGKILIDGLDIKDYDLHYLRSKFGVVSQEPTLFNGSFRDNIQYNKTQATFSQIKHAAIQANALAFIEGDEKLDVKQDQLKEVRGTGFDRNVGIKGSHISGGQKQRVAIARAILRNPQILLLDEATSALDAANELKVQQSLDRLMIKKTTISIAHRIETIKNCDLINVFEKGQIVERGTYHELLKLKGFFYNLQKGTQFL